MRAAAPLQSLPPFCTAPAPASRRQTPQPPAGILCLSTQPTARMGKVSALMTPKLYTAAPLQPLLPSCTVPAPASRRQTPQPAAQMLCLGTHCQDGNGFSAHDADSVHCRSSVTSAAFLHSSSARLIARHRSHLHRCSASVHSLLPGWFWFPRS